jgi:hypothetical protein
MASREGAAPSRRPSSAEPSTVTKETTMSEQTQERFVITTGGEYLFRPGIRALKWLADRPEDQP